jgi:hypothetical protein
MLRFLQDYLRSFRYKVVSLVVLIQRAAGGMLFLSIICSMAKYSKKAQGQVKKTMRKRKKGALKSGSGRKVKSKKQAIAIALSESREKGYKTPRKKSAKKTAKKRSKRGKSKR